MKKTPPNINVLKRMEYNFNKMKSCMFILIAKGTFKSFK